MILAMLSSLFLVGVKPVTADDSIPDYLAQVSLENLNTVVDQLVTNYGPRHSAYNQPYIDDLCTLSSDAPYPKNNYAMAADYVALLLTGMGYSVQRESIALNGGYTGDNIIVKKTGSLYPNDYIEVGAHLELPAKHPGRRGRCFRLDRRRGAGSRAERLPEQLLHPLYAFCRP